MYKHILFMLLASMLSACGGSSEKAIEKETQLPAPNNAPTLSGLFSVDAKASQVTTVVLNTADVDNDALTFSITDIPDWVSFTSENNQVTLTIAPDFFDIDDYILEFAISDGNSETKYNFNLNVLDNPDKWQNIQLTSGELLGSWVSDTNDVVSFSFLDNSKAQGVYFVDNEVIPFHWSLSESLDLTLFEPGCIEECAERDSFQIRVVAQQENKLRINVIDSVNQQTVYNLSKDQINSSIHGKYISLPQAEFNQVSTINLDENKVNMNVDMGDIRLGRTTYNNYKFYVESTIDIVQGNYQVTMTSSNEKKNFTDISYFNTQSQQYVKLDIDIIIDSISLLPSSPGLTIATIEFHAELVSDLGSYVLDDYERLKEDIEAEYQHSSVLQAVSSTSAPNFEVGNSYTGRIINDASIDLDGMEYIAGGSVFTIISETSGETTLTVAGSNFTQIMPFTWSVENDVLTIIIDEKATEHEFIVLPNGEISMTSPIIVDEVKSYPQAYPFYQVPANSFNISDYIGTFKHSVYDLFESDRLQLLLSTDGFGEYYARAGDVELTDYWKQEGDGSVSIISKYECNNNVFDYDTCYSEALMREGGVFVIRNLKLLSIDSDTYKFQYSLAVSGDDYNWAYQSHRHFEKTSQ